MAQLFKKILFPTDNSSRTGQAFKVAIAMAKQNNADLYVVSVVHIGALEEASKYESERFKLAPQFIDGMIQITAKETDDFIKKYSKNAEGIKIERIIRKGRPSVEIIAEANDKKVDLIIMSTHGRTGLSHIFVGSVAEKVLRGAPCPVLTVKPKD